MKIEPMTHFRFFLVWISLCFTIQAYAQEPLKNTKITDRISMKLPVSFNPMSREDIDSRFISSNKPIAVFTDPNRVVDLTISSSSTLWNPQDLAMMKDFYMTTFYATYDEVSISSSEIVEVNGISFISFKMNTVVKSDSKMKPSVQKYHHLMYGIYKGYLFTLNFSCPLSDRKYWEDTVAESLQTIKIK